MTRSRAVKEKPASSLHGGQQPWVKMGGELRHLRKERARIRRLVQKEFERVEPEDRQ